MVFPIWIDNLQIKFRGSILTEEHNSYIIFSFWLSDHREGNILQLLEGQVNGINLFLNQQISCLLDRESTVFNGICFHLALTILIWFRFKHLLFSCIFQGNCCPLNSLFTKSVKQVQSDYSILTLFVIFYFLFFKFELDVVFTFFKSDAFFSLDIAKRGCDN